MRTIIFLTAAVLAVGGCAGGGYYSASVATTDPDLVYVRPGVYAVANYHEPVFWSNDYYWRYDDGYWYRSRYYNRGWSHARPPRTVLSIRRPSQYTYYRPDGRRTHVDVREERVHRPRYYRDRDGRRYYYDRDSRRYVPRDRYRQDRGRRRPYVIDRS